MKKDTLTLEKAKKSPAGGVLVGKREGQTMIYDDATVGGYFVGKLHKEGGIQGINKTTGQPIEVQSSEVIITAPAVADQTKREFQGEMLTNREILSKINVSGGGVSLEQGGDIPSEIYFNGTSYNYGGNTMTDYEIMQKMNECGCEHEYKGGGSLDTYKSKIADLKRENKSTYPKVPTNKIFFNQVEVLPSSVVSTADPYLEDETKLPTESVDLKSIVPTQKMVTIPNIESTKEVELYPILFKLNDRYYVLDGHHRITNAILKDEKEVMSYVYDYKAQNSDKFNNGGQLDLVDESKKGDHPARDLNNYNDLMDVGADGQVGMENGLAFDEGGFMTDVYAGGGGIKKTNEQPSVITTVEDSWKVSRYRDGKEIYKKEDKNYSHEILRNKRGEVQLTTIVLDSLHGESFNRTYSDVRTEYFDSVEEAKKYVKENYEKMNLTTNKNEVQSLSGKVYQWSKVPSIFKNITKTKKVPFINNPIDNGLNSIIEPFLDKNEENSNKLNITGVNFDKNGITATNAHILITLPYPNEKYNGVYDINKVKKSNSKESLLINEKYAKYENVIPKKEDAGTSYLVDIYKLLQYTKTAINYANQTTFHISFRFDDDIKIGFNGKYLITTLTTLLKLGHKEVYAFISSPSRGVVLTPNKNYELGNDEILLIMPKFAYDFEGYGAEDIDNERSLKVYYDFNDNEIHNADGSIAEFKMQYESNMLLDDKESNLVQSFLNKNSQIQLPILQFAKIENKVLTVSNLETEIKIKNVQAPDGIYEFYKKNPFITIEPIDDFPSERVFNKNEVNEQNYLGEVKGKPTAFEFITFSEVFDFYLDKLLLSVGKDELRPKQTGICIKKTSDNQLFLVTTNAHTLCKINVTEYCEFEKDDRELEYILPVNFLKQFVELADGSLHFKCSKANIFIEAENIDFVARTIEGRYSNVDAIITRYNTKKIVFDHVAMNNCLSSEKAQKFIEKYSKNYSLIFSNEGNALFLKSQKEVRYNVEYELIDKIELCQIDFNYEQVDLTISLDQSVFLLMPVKDEFKENQYFAFGKNLFQVMLDTITDTEVECYFTEPFSPYIFPIDAIDYKKTLPEEKTKQQPKKVAKAKKEAESAEKKEIREAIETLLMLAEIQENDDDRKDIYEAIEILNMLKEDSYEYGGALGKKLSFEPIRTPLN
jgi:hypothetical protein